MRCLLLVAACGIVACTNSDEARPRDDSSRGRHAPPVRPASDVHGATRWLQIATVRLDSAANGQPDAYGWRSIGWDLDGVATTRADSESGSNTCKRAPTASSFVLTDGDRGTDNNFGQHFMRDVIRAMWANAEEATNEYLIKGGDATVMLRIDDAGGDDDARAPGALFVAGPRNGDVWPITPVPVETFPDGWISQGTWVSGPIGGREIHVAIPFHSAVWTVGLIGGVVTARLDGTSGTFAGAVRPTDLVELTHRMLGNAGICELRTTATVGDATVEIDFTKFDEHTMTLPDLVANAPQLNDPSRPCDVVSLGVGFTTKSAPEPWPTGVTTEFAPCDAGSD